MSNDAPSDRPSDDENLPEGDEPGSAGENEPHEPTADEPDADPTLRDLREHPELYPDELKRLSQVISDGMRPIFEQYNNLLSPSLDALQKSIAAMPAAKLSAQVLKD